MGRDVMAPRRSIATYAMVYAPPELGEKYPEALDGKLWLQSSVYLRPDSSGWLPEFFARTAILQPIDAQRQGETIATMLHASPDESAPKPGGSTDHRDEMLTCGARPGGLSPPCATNSQRRHKPRQAMRAISIERERTSSARASTKVHSVIENFHSWKAAGNQPSQSTTG